MKHLLHIFLTVSVTLAFALGISAACTAAASAEECRIVGSVDELTTALMNAKDGDTILVGDIEFKPMPAGMIVVSKNVTVKSGRDKNAVFTNATFALNGTAAGSAPLKIRFENIDFRGDQAGTPVDPSAPPPIGTDMFSVMHTMCAAIIRMNVDAAYVGCSFEGYHYGYGGVFNAVYSTENNRNSLNLTLSDCTFRNNASKYGGCVYLSGYGHNVRLDARRCAFEGGAASTGGVIWAQEADVRLSDCTLTGSGYLKTTEDAVNGGALALYDCAAELDGCLIAHNVSGGAGAGIFCEISPFRTLIMENCTVTGNSAAEDEGISVSLAKTKYDTAAAVHLYFSSLIGKQNLGGSAERFGCLLVDRDPAPCEPCEENGYCLILTPEEAREKGLIPENPQHAVLPEGKYPIPKEAADRIAGGKFSGSFGKLQVGDNYAKEVTFEIEKIPGHTESVTVRYGDAVSPEQPERAGYSFEGWEFPKGTPVENGKVFLGGELPEGTMMARWRFVLSENLYVIWVPVLVLIAAGAAVFVFCRRKKETEDAVVPAADNTEEEAAALPDGWTDRVCERPEIAGLLSRREAEVLHKILEGKSRKQIAEELFVTEATIRKHTAGIYSKLDVHNRTELIYKLTK